MFSDYTRFIVNSSKTRTIHAAKLDKCFFVIYYGRSVWYVVTKLTLCLSCSLSAASLWSVDSDYAVRVHVVSWFRLCCVYVVSWFRLCCVHVVSWFVCPCGQL